MRVSARTFIMLGALCLALTTSVEAQTVRKPAAGAPGTWRVIGTTQANHTVDHDGIIVQGFDDFRRIKFKVINAPLHILRLIVTYQDGEPDNIDVRQEIPRGGESRVIDLRGEGKRRIRRIDFWYDTRTLGTLKADVTVFGMK